ncbi:hypothetical protein [Streptomyces sp. NPDC001657]|uniref:hypothetical protein n=1 Tax=Streptomyces sp. NPDC001657 TaxID=3154522 RepID=UPI00332B0FA7
MVEEFQEVFRELVSRHPKPFFEGRQGLNPVTWHELAAHAVVLRGPQLTAADVWADRAALRAYCHTNRKQTALGARCAAGVSVRGA